MTTTDSPGSRRWQRGAQPAALLLLAGVMLILFSACDGKRITVTSSPPAATVWLNGDRIIGPTPVSIPVPQQQTLVLRISKPSYSEATVSIEPENLPPGGMLHVELEKGSDLSIECHSTPPGADVFLDGELQGKTPLHLTGLGARIYEVSFCMKARQQAMRSVDLSDAEGTVKVECNLGSLTEAYYLQQIEKAPEQIHNYADLGHHYILEHRFEEAGATFSKGVDIIVHDPGVSDSSRLWSEIQRVIDEQYEYGDATAVKAAREVLVTSLGEDMRRNSGNEPMMLYVNYALALDASDRRQQAQEVFEMAWRKFPGDKTLVRIRKQKRFAAP